MPQRCGILHRQMALKRAEDVAVILERHWRDYIVSEARHNRVNVCLRVIILLDLRTKVSGRKVETYLLGAFDSSLTHLIHVNIDIDVQFDCIHGQIVLSWLNCVVTNEPSSDFLVCALLVPAAVSQYPLDRSSTKCLKLTISLSRIRRSTSGN